MSSLQKTVEKIKSLEAEKMRLLVEIDELKKLADAKASSLEAEVASLRDDIKSLKSLMGQEKLSQQSSGNPLKPIV